VGRTCLLCGEGERHDVVGGVGVVRVRGVEGQRWAGAAPQVQQEGGVHHGHGEAALPPPPADGHVVRRALVVALVRRR